ncbi:MAG: radical SAM protein, partial [Proteobacteria bacterium]|nr:radical SAM protein [Pseudomonadota bacterium]
MEALLYEQLKDKKIKCNLCNHKCLIGNGKRGICGVRQNTEGILETLVYGKLIASHIDPIEKKPLFHFLPKSLTYSIATVGCNFKCLFCQNSDISQMPSDHNGLIAGDHFMPEDVVASAKKGKCKSISYTYTEPTVFFEFARDTAILAQKNDLKNIFVTNGYMTKEALAMIHPYLNAANVDLKSFNEDFYKNYCGAKLENVKNTLMEMKSLGIWIEVT